MIAKGHSALPSKGPQNLDDLLPELDPNETYVILHIDVYNELVTQAEAYEETQERLQ